MAQSGPLISARDSSHLFEPDSYIKEPLGVIFFTYTYKYRCLIFLQEAMIMLSLNCCLMLNSAGLLSKVSQLLLIHYQDLFTMMPML